MHVACRLGLALVWPTVASAQMPAMPMARAPSCTGAITPDGVLGPWVRPVALSAAADASDLRTVVIAIGQAAHVALLQTAVVHYPVPERPGGTSSFGGLMSLHVSQPGTYRVALGSSAWLDLVTDGKPVPSIAHSPGPACTGIHKLVDFPLQPGNYTLQVSANGEPQTTVLVVRVP